jgi:hypothetical protein
MTASRRLRAREGKQLIEKMQQRIYLNYKEISSRFPITRNDFPEFVWRQIPDNIVQAYTELKEYAGKDMFDTAGYSMVRLPYGVVVKGRFDGEFRLDHAWRAEVPPYSKVIEIRRDREEYLDIVNWYKEAAPMMDKVIEAQLAAQYLMSDLNTTGQVLRVFPNLAGFLLGSSKTEIERAMQRKSPLPYTLNEEKVEKIALVDEMVLRGLMIDEMEFNRNIDFVALSGRH